MNNKVQAQFIEFAKKSNLHQEALSIGKERDAAVKAVKMGRFYSSLKKTTKHLSGAEGACSLNTNGDGPLGFGHSKKFGLDSSGRSFLVEHFVLGEHTEDHLRIMKDPSCSALKMLSDFVTHWSWAIASGSGLVCVKSRGKWIPIETKTGLRGRMDQMISSGLPAKATEMAKMESSEVYDLLSSGGQDAVGEDVSPIDSL
jgi:hypothetical protein